MVSDGNDDENGFAAQNHSSYGDGGWEKVVVMVAGKDKPSLVHELTRCAANAGGIVVGIQQSIVEKMLTLAMIVKLDASDTKSSQFYRDVLLYGKKFGVHVEFNVNSKSISEPRHAYVLTVLSADRIECSALKELTILLSNRSVAVHSNSTIRSLLSPQCRRLFPYPNLQLLSSAPRFLVSCSTGGENQETVQQIHALSRTGNIHASTSVRG